MKIVSTKELDADFVVRFFDDVVAVPTETVYGLAASIYNPRAVERLLKLKRRPADNPLPVAVSSYRMLKEIVKEPIPEEYRRLMDMFWPGPLTLLFRSKDCVSSVIRSGLESVAVRMPKSKHLLEIIERLGAPVVLPSANISGRPSPTTAGHVVEDFGDEVKLIIDGGPCPIGLESTVVSYADGGLQILRPGGITVEDIESVANCKVFVRNRANDEETELSPGQKYKHYSPRSPLILFKGQPEEVKSGILGYIGANPDVSRIGVALHSGIDLGVPVDGRISVFNMGSDRREVCRNLFEGLRSLDKISSVILAAGVDYGEEGDAIMNRLEKAADSIVEP
ncbi:translation factor [Encephalitozoon cuniculi EcunIII-L]|nr:translation factor [Encephalitozoon cuniculi EcunIII-L]